MRWYGKTLVFFHCKSKTGKRAIVLHTTPDNARNMLEKEGLGKFETASLLGPLRKKPTILAIWTEKPDIEEKRGQQRL